MGIFIISLATFKNKIKDQEYLQRGDEADGDWAYWARIFTNPHDILLEINRHRPSIVDDVRTLTRLISIYAKIPVVDEDGEHIDCYD